MKKLLALFLSLSYLLFSAGSMQAEASIQESKESQENIFSVKQGEENTVNHFSESPSPKKFEKRSFQPNQIRKEPVPSACLSLPVPIFLKNCNIRR